MYPCIPFDCFLLEFCIQSQRMSTTQESMNHTNNPAGLTLSELEEIKDAFQLFDTKGTGKIRCSDVIDILGSFNSQESSKMRNVDHVVDMFSSQNHSDDEIEFDQFLHLLTSSKCWGKHEKDDLRNIFDLFDKEATGYISLDDLKKIATDLGETMTQEELQEMIERANPKEEGKVSPEEFYAIMTKKLFT